MKSYSCVVFPSVLALGTIFSGAAASEIGTVTEPACNGEVIVVCGEGLDPKATKIKAFCLGTADGSFRSESLEDGTRHAAAIDRQPAVPEVPPAGSLDCEVVGGGPGYLQVVMRCSRQPWISVPAVTALWAGDGKQWSRPYVVNRPQAQWLSPASQTPGEVFRIFGRTFSWTYQLPPARVYLRRQGGSELVALRPAPPHHDDGHTERWCLSAWLPSDFTRGQYQVFVHGQIARVPRRLFGTNVRQNMESDGKVRGFLKETGITLFRYPDSVDSGYMWDWDAGGVMARDGKPMTSKLARLDTVSYATKDWHTLVNFQGEVPLVSAHATQSDDGRSLQLMVINRGEKDDVNIQVALEGFVPRPEVEVLSINGPSLLSNNDVTNRQPAYHSFANAPDQVVKLERSLWTGAAARFAYPFKAHSVTVLEMQKR